MLCEQDRGLAQTLKARLRQHIPILDFRVFGSRARGNASSDSDLDVFIVIPERNQAHETAISDISWEVGFDHRVIILPLVVSQVELRETALRSAPIVENIMREGISV
ncbi:MAG TPA: nucleotidyltransferase domain-containing protein [Candidatus Ozemobacteraceae bacterium]|nr:nucleotidyltransferase domain-containing protein [Candidatus Ozemobacteraceae bacterium]